MFFDKKFRIAWKSEEEIFKNKINYLQFFLMWIKHMISIGNCSRSSSIDVCVYLTNWSTSDEKSVRFKVWVSQTGEESVNSKFMYEYSKIQKIAPVIKNL